MNDQTNDFNKEMPPRKGPEPVAQEKFTGGGNLVTMYQAQGANAESFPVLQAFQEYIEAERKQARKRIVQLSISFAVIIGVVVVGFLAAGVYMMQSTTNRLFEVALSTKESPAATANIPLPTTPITAPVAQSSPALEASIRQISEVLAKMQAEGARPPAAAVVESRPQGVQPSQNPELNALKDELLAMKEQSLKLEGQLSSMREKSDVVAPASLVVPKPNPNPVARYSVEEALEIARKTGAEKAASDKAAADKIAADKALALADSERAKLAQIEIQKRAAMELSASRSMAEREAQIKRESQKQSPAQPIVADSKTQEGPNFAVADKAPPVTPQGVKVPEPLKDMMMVSIPLKTKQGDMVPWRVFVPE